MLSATAPRKWADEIVIFSSVTETPLPLAIRWRQRALRMCGLRRSCSVIPQIIASLCRNSFSYLPKSAPLSASAPPGSMPTIDSSDPSFFIWEGERIKPEVGTGVYDRKGANLRLAPFPLSCRRGLAVRAISAPCHASWARLLFLFCRQLGPDPAAEVVHFADASPHLLVLISAFAQQLFPLLSFLG